MIVNLQAWARELESKTLQLGDEPGAGAIENLWTISAPTTTVLSTEELAAFVEQAVAIRQAQAEKLAISPATFYLWHDEQAGQLRFSVARSNPENLPFGATVRLVSAPQEVIISFLGSPSRDGIPWSELVPVAIEDEDSLQEVQFELDVWAKRIF